MTTKTLDKNTNIKNSQLKKSKGNIFYLSLIFGVWLVSYIVCQFALPHRLGWDEVAYLSVARGIAEDFHFGARSYTVMGLLNYGFPHHLINFPISSTYIALFFKLFGSTLTVGYFSTWVAALGVCLFLYFNSLILTNKNHKLSFLISMSYLFFPTVMKNCDSGMMEQFGCLLLSGSVFLILKDYEKGKFGYLTLLKLALSFTVLWLYKTIFIGYLFGSVVFLFLAYNQKITGRKIQTVLPFPAFVGIALLIFAALFYVFKQFVFYPVAPMVNFSHQQEMKQAYAEFLGGVFNDFPNNFLSNYHYFLKVIVGSYFVYPTAISRIADDYASFRNSVLGTTCCYVLNGIYFLMILFMTILASISWKKLSAVEKLFTVTAISSVVVFNLILCSIMKTYHENLWRYNMYYLPLSIPALWILLRHQVSYFEPFTFDHPVASKVIAGSFLVFLYFPLFLSSIRHYIDYEHNFHKRAKFNDELIKSVVKDEKPAFIYFNDGIHTTFTQYPIRQIMKDATNEQLLKVNSILPEPVEYLFLRPSDWLFQNNKEMVLMGAPILNDSYKLYGFNNDAQIVVYKYEKPKDKKFSGKNY